MLLIIEVTVKNKNTINAIQSFMPKEKTAKPITIVVTMK